MPNPVERVVAAIKSGDRRVLLIGAALVGGVIGLIVYYRNRGKAGTPSVLPSAGMGGGGGEAAGGSGGGGGGDTSTSLFGPDTGSSSGSGIGLPELPGIAQAAAQESVPTAYEPMSTLPSLLPTAGSFFGALPTLPALPELPVVAPSYSGASYGNDLGALPELSVASTGAFRGTSPALATATPVLETPALTPAIVPETPVLPKTPAVPTGPTAAQVQQFQDASALAQAARQQYLALQEQKQALSGYAAVRESVSNALAQQQILNQYNQAAVSSLQSLAKARQSVSNYYQSLPVSNLQVYNPAQQSNLQAYGQARQSVSNYYAQQGILQQYNPAVVQAQQSYAQARQSVSNYYAQQVQQPLASYAQARQSVSQALQPQQPKTPTYAQQLKR